MNATPDRLVTRESILRSRGASLPPGSTPPADILDSWLRCADARLDAAHALPQQVVNASELMRRRQQLEPVRRLALAEIETLHRQIAGSNFLLAFADADGVVLDLFADNRFHMSTGDSPIVEGSCWSEELSGTNGLGTSIAIGRSVAVNGFEHFFFKHGTISCAASPIRDAYGRIVGVLDASSYVESRQRHTQALVQMAAVQVENLLLNDQMSGSLVLAVHPRAEFLGTLSCGLIAFDAQGAIRAVNARTHGLLTGLDLAPGTPFEHLFDESFETFAARATPGLNLRLCDVLGSTLAARCLQAPADKRLHLPPSLAGGKERTPIAPGPAVVDLPHRLSSVRAGQPVMVADDPQVARIVKMAEAASRLGVPVLIHGETGTGKELLARHVHETSNRSGAFVAVNCAAVPAELFEAELFGYLGGAFTGARREGSRGLIESAHGGTLLLDEIGDLPPALQAGLLRFLDDQHVRPVGAIQSRKVDVQLIAASHVDLEAEVLARRFRSDLFHRLNVVRLTLPPLRERTDFRAVAQQVLAGLDPAATLSETALHWLARQEWRGNLRELRSALTRALLMHEDGHLAVADFAGLAEDRATATSGSALDRDAMNRVLDELGRQKGSVSLTARNLRISRTTVYRYLRMAQAGGEANAAPTQAETSLSPEGHVPTRD